NVCEQDPWCCHVDWDRQCVAAADELCYGTSHDHCTDINGPRSALEIEADSTTFFGNTGATEDATDPGFCCNADAPGAKGYGSVWFKFVATDSSVQIDTCYSDPAGDSLVNVFSVGDPTSEATACQSLSLIGCGDNDGCSNGDKHSRFCVAGLTPGQTYYIMLASKTPETKGTHQLELKSPCQYLVPFPSGDCNLNGHPDGCDLADGTSNDCNGNSIPDKCEIADGHELDCNINAIPDSCDIANSAVTDCNHDSVPDECELAANHEHDCNHNTVHDACDILDGVSLDCQPNGIPDECDIADGNSLDCDGDAVPDECSLFRQTLTADPPTGGFGYSMAFAGDQLLVGDPSALREDGLDAGAVHVLRKDAGLWVEHEVLTPPNSGNYSGFGTSISVNGNSALIVAWGGGPDGDRIMGDVFVFERDADHWTPRGRLPDVYNSAEYNDLWGRALLGSDYAAAAAYSYSGFECGGVTVHTFRRADDTWKYEGVLGGDASFSSCSFDFAASGDLIAAMGSRAFADGVFYYDPTAHVFQRTASGWRHDATFIPPSAKSLSCLAIRDNLLLIGGSRIPDTWPRPVDLAYLYRLQGSTWILESERNDLDSQDVYYLCPAHFFRGGLASFATMDRITDHVGIVLFERRSSGMWGNAGTFWIPVFANWPGSLTMAPSPDFGAIGLTPWDTFDPPVYGTVTAFALPSIDCDSNGTPDRCELRDGLAEDCNHNFTPDQCDARLPGDYDFDGRVDLQDFAGLQRCFTGNNVALAPCCGIFDLGPGDGDVDLGDAAAFPATMTGP
ncbi:MAG: hypothetical protein Q7R41_08055, partial [Phycisphaerales bacterium]|nr:hypothetical protein [Phycisphaerales bacterium]